MIELASNVFYLPGKNNSRFPYCACLYIAGKRLRVLVDAGMGRRRMGPVKTAGVDLLILTHCHIDHRLTYGEIPETPIWCHEKEAPFLTDRSLFWEASGLARGGIDLAGLPIAAQDIFGTAASRLLKDHEQIDLGGLTVEILHTPGHTPGHLAIYIPEFELLFSGDVDLTRFGPFYGHDFADIDDFIASIERLRRLEPRITVSGHAGPFDGDISERFDAYRAVIDQRDHRILENLKQPLSLEELAGRNLIYRSYAPDDQINRWFEQVHIEKQLRRLAVLGYVRQEGSVWFTPTGRSNNDGEI
jgi:glyoxylase-like metal-dependent hydrolase (beta-lactamase superfamily II)